MNDGSTIQVDVHGISKAVAGVVANGDFEDLASFVTIASQDLQDRTVSFNFKCARYFLARGQRLNVLGDLANGNAGQFFYLSEKGASGQIEPVERDIDARMKIDICMGQGASFPGKAPRAAKARPLTSGGPGDLDSDFCRQWATFLWSVINFAVTRILQQFTHVRERLVKCAAASGRRLNGRTGAAPTSDQSLGLQAFERFAYGKAADIISSTQGGFRRKRAIAAVLAGHYRRAQLRCELQVARDRDRLGAFARRGGSLAQVDRPLDFASEEKC